MTTRPRFRAQIRRVEPLVIPDLAGRFDVVKMGWRCTVLDLDRSAHHQIAYVSIRGSQQQALEEACAYIAARVAGGPVWVNRGLM